MKEIKVNAERKYSIFISKNNKGYINMIKDFVKDKKVMIITDDKVAKLHLSNLKNDLIKNDIKVYSHIFKNGELSKNFKTYQEILLSLTENEFNRNDIIISFGGGVVGDISAFVASTYLRGIKFIQIPTTLLSMIDSSVGGKTGIDFDNYKNIVGSFYSPFLVLIDTKYLDTLDNDEMLSGYGEFVKYAILKKEIYEKAKNFKNKIDLEDLVYSSLKLKAEIVSKDLYEKNIRMLLNLGHTIGHAIESKYNLKIKHGHAVVEGIRYVLDISKKLLNLDENEINKINNLISLFSFKKIINNDIKEYIDIIKHDKKMKNKDTINLVLIKEIGNCIIRETKFEEII